MSQQELDIAAYALAKDFLLQSGAGKAVTPETRLAILWIKDVWHRMPSYPDRVSGMDVYDAVLEHGVRTPEQFGGYLRRRGLPAP